MKPNWSLLLQASLLMGLTAPAAALPSESVPHTRSEPAFSYTNETFLRHGEPFQILGGQIDPQRVPPEYWRDRLQKVRAMGLNTVFSYIFWNMLEPQQGKWTLGEKGTINDVATYFRIAQDEGLDVVLRPGPYICGERDWGGFPAWLSEIPGMEVRKNNKPFLDASRSYVEHLAAELAPLQASKGGPILMVQIENEYGSFDSDHEYTSAVRDIMQASFEMPLYTTDGGGLSYLEGGQVHGVLAVTDGNSKTGFEAQDMYVTDPTSMGPHLNGEFYTTWMDIWGSDSEHHTAENDTEQLKKTTEEIDWVLSQNASFNLYMFHGGTNWGFENGGLMSDGGGHLTPVTTSYDYGSPLDESGRTNEFYYALRKVVLKHTQGKSTPDAPKNKPLLEFPEVQLEPASALFDVLPGPSENKSEPVNMEALGQATGFVLYEHEAKEDAEGVVKPGDKPRDRVLVYVNGEQKGVIDGIYTISQIVSVSLKKGDKLQLLVENLGRVDYGPKVVEQQRGIIGNISVGVSTLSDWSSYSLPLQHAPEGAVAKSNTTASNATSPQFFTGSFATDGADGALDTFVNIPHGIKGLVWVNGKLLGRYWVIGPQQSLYLPSTFLRKGDNNAQNEIVVLELEPGDIDCLTAVGLSYREWGNNPDPDAP